MYVKVSYSFLGTYIGMSNIISNNRTSYDFFFTSRFLRSSLYVAEIQYVHSEDLFVEPDSVSDSPDSVSDAPNLVAFARPHLTCPHLFSPHRCDSSAMTSAK